MDLKQNQKLDEFHYHEVLDRLSIIMGGIDDNLISHPVVEKHENLRLLILDGASKLWDAYQLAGKIDHDLWKGEYGA